mmetsp:Transcript_13250/g.37295  ORF Transcript_13250/g.37295 Transcript_13250/m.37295 type:complete len:334 (-) Transcript_13250:856-1857(-)
MHASLLLRLRPPIRSHAPEFLSLRHRQGELLQVVLLHDRELPADLSLFQQGPDQVLAERVLHVAVHFGALLQVVPQLLLFPHQDLALAVGDDGSVGSPVVARCSVRAGGILAATRTRTRTGDDIVIAIVIATGAAPGTFATGWAPRLLKGNVVDKASLVDVRGKGPVVVDLGPALFDKVQIGRHLALLRQHDPVVDLPGAGHLQQVIELSRREAVPKVFLVQGAFLVRQEGPDPLVDKQQDGGARVYHHKEGRPPQRNLQRFGVQGVEAHEAGVPTDQHEPEMQHVRHEKSRGQGHIGSVPNNGQGVAKGLFGKQGNRKPGSARNPREHRCQR